MARATTAHTPATAASRMAAPEGSRAPVTRKTAELTASPHVCETAKTRSTETVRVAMPPRKSDAPQATAALKAKTRLSVTPNRSSLPAQRAKRGPNQ